ncbi:hypothetical protein GLOTRDRAFT_133175 [Gloeophyllum trabeum ATCC 11539]|uniref:JmjC domain-containing protein n=1 Tax=Gloeophyllum trabeum (strain ATCC 11539 / FP-39264 / Madison 617) TaxID=670483 RepID=S7RFL4_GLOTA|nr:uncharacterized protein GLOTRDRAFT_133175 [Gloeophyllum trabeum ATCC 11539]EPQ51304.1 hypothetical protein GLOTRDRAFT_133175 [Gloeophyllum trabeum ATCC 11539]
MAAQLGVMDLVAGVEGVEFPPGTGQVKWASGIVTMEPWITPIGQDGPDVLGVRSMASTPDISQIESKDSFVYIFDIRDLCKNIDDLDLEDRTTVVHLIKDKISRGIPVLVRGFPLPSIEWDFSSVNRMKGSLLNPISIQEARLRMASETYTKSPVADLHLELKLGDFIAAATEPDSEDSPKMCGNLLDSHSVDWSAMPWVITDINEQATTVYQNRRDWHIRLNKNAEGKEIAEPETFSGPQSMHPDGWQLQMWDLFTHGGFFTRIHHDAAGAGTWMAIRVGGKMWNLVDVSQQGIRSRDRLVDRFYHATDLFTGTPSQPVPHKAITVCLQCGDILIQPPNIMHCVYTPVKSIATGGHFYMYSSMHLTQFGCRVDHRKGGWTTNQVHPGASHLMINMALALPNFSDKPMLKVPFLGLARLILDRDAYEPSLDGVGTARYYPQDIQHREELGELDKVKKIIQAVLEANNIPLSQVDILLQSLGRDYKDPGDEQMDLSCLRE